MEGKRVRSSVSLGQAEEFGLNSKLVEKPRKSRRGAGIYIFRSSFQGVIYCEGSRVERREGVIVAQARDDHKVRVTWPKMTRQKWKHHLRQSRSLQKEWRQAGRESYNDQGR